MKSVSSSIAVAISFLLSACGGGGSDSNFEPISSTNTFQLRQAWVNYINGSSSKGFTVSGNISFYPISGSGTLTSGAPLSGNFEEKPAISKTFVMTGEARKPPEVIPIGYSKTIYTDTNYNYLGSEGADYRVGSDFNIPETAKTHAAGILYKEVIYVSKLNKSKIGTSTLSYVLEPDTSATVLLKMVQDDKDLSGAIMQQNTVVFKMTTAGELTRVSEFSVVSGDPKDGLNDITNIKY